MTLHRVGYWITTSAYKDTSPFRKVKMNNCIKYFSGLEDGYEDFFYPFGNLLTLQFSLDIQSAKSKFKNPFKFS
jgi:hypothetical protein